MAATHYRDKRRCRKAIGNGPRLHPSAGRRPAGVPALISLGTIGALLPAAVTTAGLAVWVADRYEVRVSSGFDAPTLLRLVRTLEQLA